MIVKVLLFGAAREAAGGAAVVDVEVEEGATAAAVLEALRSPDRGPLASVARRSRLAVGRELAPPGRAVRAGDEVALIPPVGGG